MTNKFVVLLLLATLTVQQIQMQYQPINLESYYKIPHKLSYNKPLVFSPIGLEGGQSTWSQIFALSPPKITCSNGYFLLNERCNAPKIYQSVQKQKLSYDFSKIINFQKRLLASMNPIRDKIWPWYNNPIESVSQSTTQTGTSIISQTQQQQCRLTSFDFKSVSEQLLNVDGDINVLYPGSFIQSKYLSKGASSLVSAAVSQQKREPIRLHGDPYFAPFDTVSSTSGDVHNAIKNTIATNNGYSAGSIFYSLQQSTDIKALSVQFKFSTKILDKIGLSGSFDGTWQSKNKKYILTFIQKIMTFAPDYYVRNPDEVQVDAISVFLNSAFTEADVDNMAQYGAWGPNNPPLFVGQVYYGRMVVVTVDQNQYTRQLYASIKGQKGSTSAQLSAKFTSLFQDSSVKLFSLGPFSSLAMDDIKSGNWVNFLSQNPNTNSQNQALKPIGFKVFDFKMRPVTASNILQYNELKCSPKPVFPIKFIMYDVWQSAQMFLMRKGQDSWTSIYSAKATDGAKILGSTGEIDLTDKLSSGDNQIKVINTADKTKWLRQHERKVSLKIFAQGNGGGYYNEYSGCAACKGTMLAFTCTVNKFKGSIQCISY